MTNYKDTQENQQEGNVSNSSRRDRFISGELIAILIALMMQTGAGVWWASNLTSRVGNLEKQGSTHVTKVEYQGVVGLVSDCKQFHREIDRKLDSVVENTAEMKGRYNGGN